MPMVVDGSSSKVTSRATSSRPLGAKEWIVNHEPDDYQRQAQYKSRLTAHDNVL